MPESARALEQSPARQVLTARSAAPSEHRHMRKIVYVALALPLLGLGACASSGGPRSLQDERAQLERDCDRRGGMVVPSGNSSGEPRLDNFCKINGLETPGTSGR
jgi:hypothetical protein